MVIEIETNKNRVRIITGYGPQETWPESERLPFFDALDAEVLNSKLSGKSIIIQLDANSKLGSDYIENDIHEQSVNGQLLAGIIERHNLVVVNSLKDKCRGSITRKRVTSKGKEESIIDFVVVSDDLTSNVVKLLIDEDKNYAITSLRKRKGVLSCKESDHMSMITTLNIGQTRKNLRNNTDIFNIKNRVGLEKFRKVTSDTKVLSEAVKEDRNVNENTNKFIQKLNGILHQCFKKIRVKERFDPQLVSLFEERSRLRGKEDKESREKLAKVEEELEKLCAKDNAEKVKEELEGIENEDGGIHPGKLWALRKKLFPKSRDPPTAMINEEGDLVTFLEEIENLNLKTYKNRLRSR